MGRSVLCAGGLRASLHTNNQRRGKVVLLVAASPEVLNQHQIAAQLINLRI